LRAGFSLEECAQVRRSPLQTIEDEARAAAAAGLVLPDRIVARLGGVGAAPKKPALS
jgi:hypothetical protein